MADDHVQQGEDIHNGSAQENDTRAAKAPSALSVNGNEEPRRAQQTSADPPGYSPLFPDSDGEGSDEQNGNDRDIAILSPTSVTSPPYWTSHHTHQRVASNMSNESIAAPGAITLQDNEIEDVDGTNVYGRDRNKACWAKSVQVKDYVLVNGSSTNIGAFAVWNIRVETLNGSHMYIRKRYSEFDDLRKKLIMTFPNFEAAVPTLPPKSVFNNFRSKFLEKRRAGLQYFLNCILLNPEFSGSPVLKEFLFA